MISSEIKASISSSVLCWLATASENGLPNVSPKEIFTAFGNEHLLIANIMSPGSIKNIKANAQAAVSFIDILKQKGFQLKGFAQIISKKDDNFEMLHRPLFDLAGPKYPIQSIIKIKVEHTKPIVAPNYILFPETTEEEQIKSAIQTYRLK